MLMENSIQIYSAEQLREELRRRQDCWEKGLCDYCLKSFWRSEVCEAGDFRHRAASDLWARDWRIYFYSEFISLEKKEYSITIPKYSTSSPIRLFNRMDSFEIARQSIVIDWREYENVVAIAEWADQIILEK